jgi:hypothetical protein
MTLDLGLWTLDWMGTLDYGYFRPDMRLDVVLFRGQMKTRTAIKPIAIQERYRGHLERHCGSNQFLRH